MSKLMHTPYRIGNIVISNRIVKSAMFEYCANQGRITDQHRQIYEDAARGADHHWYGSDFFDCR